MTELDHILTLIKSDKADNCELAMLLLVGNKFPAGYELFNVFKQLADFYNSNQINWGGLIDDDYYRLLLDAAIKHIPKLRGIDQSYALAELLGTCFLRPQFESLDEWEDLYEETIAIFDQPERCAFLLNIRQPYSFSRANEYFFEMGKQEWLDCKFRPLTDWQRHFKAWQENQKTSPKEQTALLLNKLLSPIQNLIETYCFHDECQEHYPILENCLGTIWYSASLYKLRELQNPIAVLLKSTQFDSKARQQIIMKHHLFRIPETVKERIVGMSCDCEPNLYDLDDTDLRTYLINFTHYHYLIDFNEISPIDYQLYKGMTHQLWKYYYLPELMPYLQVILTNESNCADTNYYLAQYYQLDKNPAVAINYYLRYIALVPKNIPANNWFLSEMEYKMISYKPSALYATVQIGQVYEQQLNDPEKAEYYYRKSIQLAPNHHQAGYWQLLLLLAKKELQSYAVWNLLKAYFNIFFEETNWLNPNAYSYSAASEIGDRRNSFLDIDRQKVMLEYNGLPPFAYSQMATLYMSLLLELSEFLYWEEDYATALEAVLMSKKLFLKQTQQPIRQDSYKKKTHYPIPCKEVRIEDILYFQAICVEEETQDYWQARSLLEKALKKNSHYQPAKAALARLKRHMGY